MGVGYLVYPILCYTPEWLERLDDSKWLLYVPESDLHNGHFEKLRIIDSECRKYSVVSASKRRFSFSPLELLEKPGARRIWVELKLSEPELLGIIDVKSLVSRLIIENRWYKAVHGKPEEIQAQINGCQTIGELMSKVSFHTNFRSQAARWARQEQNSL